jgi:nitronate monooxygenase
MFPATRVASLLGTRYPIVQAPMAGGFVTPELVAAVSGAGGLGSIAGAFLSPDELRETIGAVRRLTDRPFAVNLFVSLPTPRVDPEALAAMNALLAPVRAELGLPQPEGQPEPLPPGFVEDQIDVVVEERVPVFSFTFGVAPFDAAKKAGSVIVGTATTTAEARALEEQGVDIVVAQAGEAGGHRGTFLEDGEGLIGGLALVPQLVDRVSVPVVLAGGVMDGRGIAAALALGAEGVQLGTAFLGCPESGTPEPYRQALAAAADSATAVTAAYSGRRARAIHTQLIETIERSGIPPLPFPLQAMLLGDIRSAAGPAGRADLLFLLAGQAAGLIRHLPADELVQTLVRETQETLSSLAG